MIILDVYPNPGKASFGKPYDSTQGLPSDVILIVLLEFLIFAIYVGFKVWKGLRDEKRNKK